MNIWGYRRTLTDTCVNNKDSGTQNTIFVTFSEVITFIQKYYHKTEREKNNIIFIDLGKQWFADRTEQSSGGAFC